jgi:hypothetical protein
MKRKHQEILAEIALRGPGTIREMADRLSVGIETTTSRLRNMARGPDSLLVVIELRDTPTGAAKVYGARTRPAAPTRAWQALAEAGEVDQLLARCRDEARRMVAEEVDGALRTWALWVIAGRPALKWSEDAHLAMVLAIDRLVSEQRPATIAALEAVHGVRRNLCKGDACITLHETYEEGLRELQAHFSLPN